MDRQSAVYILASHRNGTLYVGVTSNLPARVWQHRNDLVDGFSREYGTHLLVYFEMHGTMIAAITREKQIRVEKTLEAAPDRIAQPRLARSLRRDQSLVETK